MFLNDVGIWTRVGNKWTTGSWKIFRHRYKQKLAILKVWLEDRQPIITPSFTTTFDNHKSSDDQDAYRKYLYQASKGYKGSQKKGRPNKVPNRKDTFVNELSFYSGLTTHP